jgi:hypothetical protein
MFSLRKRLRAFRASDVARHGSRSIRPAVETLEDRCVPSGFARSFDYDTRADMVTFRPSNGQWSVLTSTSGFTSNTVRQWGGAGDVPIQNSDFDGDGKADMAVWRPSNGTWYVLTSSSGFTYGTNYSNCIIRQWGAAGDTPIQNSDFDGDGRADMAVWRPSTGMWCVLTSSSGFNSYFTRQWGAPGDVPIQNSDFDGDGKADMVTWRPSSGQWSVLTSSSGFTYGTNYGNCIVRQWGAPGDVPIQNSDFDGDGKADMVTWRPSNGQWSVLTSSSGFTSNIVRQWGGAGDTLIQGSDFDGDGKADMAVWRPSNGTWYVLTSSSGFSYGTNYSNCIIRQWGAAGDIPMMRSPWTACAVEYAATAGETDVHGTVVQSILGAPTSDETDVPDVPGARMVTYQGGTIYWSAATGAHVVYGDIGAKYNSAGGPTAYGLPTSDEANVPAVPGERVTYFQGGRAIYWSAATGAHLVYGDIGAEYAATAGETDYYGGCVQGDLGAPTSDEMNVSGVSGARMNTFQRGTIYWSAATGAHVVYGDIGAKYASLGGPTSYLGLPAYDEQGIPEGGRVTGFVNGKIWWTPLAGAYAVNQWRVVMTLDTTQPQTDDWSCGPNSLTRVLRYYGFNVLYRDVRNATQSDSLVSEFHLGTTPATLRDLMSRWVPATLEQETSLERVLQVLATGKPVIALIQSGTLVGSVPNLHWIALRGFDLGRQEIYYTDTDGGNYTFSFADFQAAWNWSAPWYTWPVTAAAGLKAGTIIY